MASHIGKGGEHKLRQDRLDQRIAFGQHTLGKADAIASAYGLPEDDLIVGAKAKRMAVDADAQGCKTLDEIGGAVIANQVVGQQIIGRLGPAAPIEIDLCRTCGERQVGDLAGDQVLLGRRDHPHGDIGIPSQQVLDLVRGDDLDLYSPFLLTQPGHHRRQHIG